MSDNTAGKVSRSDCTPWRDESTLRHYYHTKNNSSSECGRILGCSKRTVLHWMKKHNIDRDPGPNRKGPWRSKETLREEYVEKERSMNELAEAWDTSTSTIHNWLNRHGLSSRDAIPPSGEDHWNYKGEDAGPAPRECPTCETTHTPSDGRVQYCSRECAFEEMRDRVTKVCEGCGESFEVPKSQKGAKYCSMECTREKEEVECEQCGVMFEVRPSRSHRKFCSRECSQAWHTGENHPFRKERIERECATCGDSIYQPPWKAKKSKRTFCDVDCRAEWLSEWVSGKFTGEDHWMHDIDPEDHPMYAGGAFPYGPGWNDEKKRAVRERDGRECQHCGRSEEEHQEIYGTKHHVHHIEKARSFDDHEARNAMENLITLCHGECHATWERMSPLRPVVASDG